MGSEINENLTQLRKLVDTLDKEEVIGDYYHNTLKQIENLIEDEKCIINEISDDKNKIKHYENVCKSVLHLITRKNKLNNIK